MVFHGMPNKHQTITIQKIGHILVLYKEYKQTDSLSFFFKYRPQKSKYVHCLKTYYEYQK